MSSVSPRTVLAGFLLLVATAATTAPASAQEIPRYAEKPCVDDDLPADAVCGTLTVWENRPARSGRTLGLHVVVLPATGPDPRPDPIYILTGGPGQAASSVAGGWAGNPFRASRDIVMMDQRGTGRSNGLFCLQPEDAPVEVYLGQIFDPEHIAACRERLERQADLTQYTSPIALDDLDDLRTALGHERINLSGGSYGTRAALVYIRRHGAHVRSAILNASMSLSQTMPEHMAEDAEAAIRGVIRDCLDDSQCAAKYPDLEDDYAAAVEGARRPVPVTLPDPRTGETVEATMQPEGLAESLRAMMYDPGATRSIPMLLHAAATQGDYDGFARFGAARAHGISRLAAAGLYLSVTCAEDVPFADEAAEYERGRGTFLGDARARSHFEACRRWARGSVPEDFHDNVVSDVPVLIINGTHDPVTPPRWGAEAARHLTNGYHVVVPHGHHGAGGLENAGTCLTAIQAAFLADPLTRPDLGCLSGIRRRPFRE